MERTKRTPEMDRNLLALELFSSASFLSVNKKLLNQFGPSLSIFICNLIDKLKYFQATDKLQEDGSFYLTFQNQSEQTGMNEYELRKCKKILKNKNILTTEMRGIPPKEYYTINLEKLIESYLNPIPLKFKGIALENLKECPLEFSSNNIKDNKYNNNKEKDIDNTSYYLSVDGIDTSMINKINHIIEFWNNLPNSTKHTNPDTKIYLKCTQFIHNLLSGFPLEVKKDNSPKLKFLRFCQDMNINQDIYTKSWDSEEIKNIIQIVHDNWPNKNKISLQEVFWSEFARRNQGFSPFLMEASKTNISEEYLNLAKKLAEAVNNGSSPTKQLDWALQFKIFIDQENEDIEKISELLDWYGTQYGQKYVPVADDAKEFCKKLTGIKRARTRQEMDSKDNGIKEQDPINTKPPEQIISEFLDNEPNFIRIYTKDLFNPLKELIDADDSTIAQSIVKLSKSITEVQEQVNTQYNPKSETFKEIQEKRYTPERLIRYYILWLQDNQWITNRTPALLDIRHSLFKKYLSHESEDNFSRNPLTGEWMKNSS